MVDFRLSERDKLVLARTRAESEICRTYARFYDENEGDFPPDELPEAEEFYANAAPIPAEGLGDSGAPVMGALTQAGQNWAPDLDRRAWQCSTGCRGYARAKREVAKADSLDGDHRAGLWL
jgi:hypothetical protein